MRSKNTQKYLQLKDIVLGGLYTLINDWSTSLIKPGKVTSFPAHINFLLQQYWALVSQKQSCEYTVVKFFLDRAVFNEASKVISRLL